MLFALRIASPASAGFLLVVLAILVSSPAWAQVPGESEPGDRFGAALATGDFDGDGFADLVIGHFNEAVGGVNGAGEVTVLYGSEIGVRADGAQAINKSTPGVPSNPGTDRFGAALAVGDFDGDGFDDLAVGSPFDDVGFDNTGAVIVLYGSADGLTGDGSQFWHQDSPDIGGGNEEGDQFGSALAAGDFDGDGFADLAVGVPAEDIGDVGGAGAVNVLYGTATGLASAGDQFFAQDTAGFPGGVEPGDTVGSALATGDFDGDGFDDLAIGAPREDIGDVSDAGAVYVLFGEATGLSTSGAQTLRQGAGIVGGGPATGDWFGSALATGDIDGDGFDELAIGAAKEDWTTTETTYENSGIVQTVYGSPTGLDARDDVRLFFQDAAATGDAVAIGNAGGATAFLVLAAPEWDFGKVANIGSIGVLFADGDGLPSANVTQLNQAFASVPDDADADDGFASAVAVGDFDGDGFDDLAVGVPGEDVAGAADAGAVHVFVSNAAGRIDRAGGLFLIQGGPLVTPAETDAPETASALAAPSPNPSADRATMRFSLAAPGDVRLAVYDMLGREIAVVARGTRAAGEHVSTLDTSALPTGVYLVRLDLGEEAFTKRLTVAR